MKFFRLFCQILVTLWLISSLIGYAQVSNIDEFGHVRSTQPNEEPNLELSVEATPSIITVLKDKRDYLWTLILIVALYLAYRANHKAKKLAQKFEKRQQTPIHQDEPKYWLAIALPKILILIGILSILATILVFGLYFFNLGAITTEHTRWGTFGDFVGGTLNSIFGLLGLIALLFTIVLQSRELQLARKEFKRSTGTSQEQNQMYKRQQFENTFFHLLNVHNNIVNSLELREFLVLESITRGRECLTKCYEIFKEEKYLDRYNPVTIKELPQIQQEVFLEKSFRDFLLYIKKHYQLSIEHYFVHLCYMIEFLGKDETQVFTSESGVEDKKAKQRYMNIILSQLSDAEITLLFFYCISNFSHCWKLMMEYALLNDSREMKLVTTEYCEYYFAGLM